MNKKAFTLTEVSVMLVLIGLVVVFFTRISSDTVRQGAANAHVADIEQAAMALIGEAKLKGRLPIPYRDSNYAINTADYQYQQAVTRGLLPDTTDLRVGLLYLSSNTLSESSNNEPYAFISGIPIEEQDNPTFIGKNICSAAGGDITYKKCIEDNCSVTENVAALIYSLPIDNATWNGSTSTFTWNALSTASSTAQVRAIQYHELDVALNCPAPAILPDSLPPVYHGEINTIIFRTNSNQVVRWCAEGAIGLTDDLTRNITVYEGSRVVGSRPLGGCNFDKAILGDNARISIDANVSPGVYPLSIFIWDAKIAGPYDDAERAIDVKTYGISVLN